MEEKVFLSPENSQKNIIQIELVNTMDTADTCNNHARTKRIKKPKFIEDLGFEEKRKIAKKKKIGKLNGKNKKLNGKALDGNSSSIVNNTNTKMKHCYKIFYQLKEYEEYSKFPLFAKIEKNLKSSLYSHHKELASDIRKIFNQYFTTYSSSPDAYNKTLSFCNFFETLYRDYDNKIFTKESRNLIEIKKKFNRLKKEIREKNNQASILHPHTANHKLKINFNDYKLSLDHEKKASRKYKINLANNIRNLSPEQIKGMMGIISDCFNVDNNTMEIDINKLPVYKLKELDRYVKKCVKVKPSSGIIKDDVVSAPFGKGNENINVNISINNNFMMKNYTSDIINTDAGQKKMAEDTKNNVNSGILMKKRNSILSDSDSLSSEDDSESDSLSSMKIKDK